MGNSVSIPSYVYRVIVIEMSQLPSTHLPFHLDKLKRCDNNICTVLSLSLSLSSNTFKYSIELNPNNNNNIKE